jgi:hypothetical protein
MEQEGLVMREGLQQVVREMDWLDLPLAYWRVLGSDLERLLLEAGVS